MEYIMEKVLTDIDVVNYLNINLILVLLSIGYLSKHHFCKLDNKNIPYVLLAVSLVFTIVTSGFNINSICNSIVSTAIAVGLHSSGKNILKSAIDKNKDIISDIEESIDDDNE